MARVIPGEDIALEPRKYRVQRSDPLILSLYPFLYNDITLNNPDLNPNLTLTQANPDPIPSPIAPAPALAPALAPQHFPITTVEDEERSSWPVARR